MIKILVVDDNKLICDNLKDILELKGYQVICVYDGYQAVEAVRKYGCKIALMDVRMPGMSGLNTLKSLKQFAPKLNVIFITAFAEDFFYREGFKSEDFEVITKPINIDKLFVKLGKCVKKI